MIKKYWINAFILLCKEELIHYENNTYSRFAYWQCI